METFFQQLFRYNEGATGVFLDVFEEKEIHNERMVRLLSHLAITPHNWLVRIGVMSPMYDFFEVRMVSELRQMNQSAHVAIDALLKGSHPNLVLGSLITYQNVKGETYEQPLQDLLFHILNHSTYHRGQIAMLLREAGYTPPATDFVYFNREKKS